MTKRDYNQEFKDTAERKYAYEFDYIHRDYMMKALAPWMRGGRALELGCFEGEFTKRIVARFDQVDVVEAADKLIDVARSKVPGSVRFHHATFEAVQLEGGVYDAVFLVHTLEHLDDPQLVLRRIGAWLRPGGSLFLVVPNARAPSRQIATHMGLISHHEAVTPGEWDHGHRRTYALDTLEREARDAGLAVTARGGILFKPLANYQIDKAMAAGIIDEKFIEGCYHLGSVYPDLCASVYVVCQRGEGR